MRRRAITIVLIVAVVGLGGMTPVLAHRSADGIGTEQRTGGTLVQESNVQLVEQAAQQAAIEAANSGANVTDAERQAAITGAVWAVSYGEINNTDQLYQAAYGASYGAMVAEGATPTTIANAVAGGVLGGTYVRATAQSVVTYAAIGAANGASLAATFDEFDNFRPEVLNPQFILAATAGSTAGGIQGARLNASTSLTRIAVGTQTGAINALNNAIVSPHYTATGVFQTAEQASFTFIAGSSAGNTGVAGTAGGEPFDGPEPPCVLNCPPENNSTGATETASAYANPGSIGGGDSSLFSSRDRHGWRTLADLVPGISRFDRER